jgi:hypothetical protein
MDIRLKDYLSVHAYCPNTVTVLVQASRFTAR